MDTYINLMTQQVKNMMARMNELKTFMTKNQRQQFTKSFMLSKLNYGAQFFAGERTIVRRKYHSAVLSVARWIRNNCCFMESVQKICRSVNIEIHSQQISKEAANFCLIVYFNRRPIQIVSQIQFPRTPNIAKLILKYKKNHEKYDWNLISQSINIYNIILGHLKQLPMRKFNKAIAK